MNKIGTLSENSLHADIKQYILEEGDKTEEKVSPYVIDIVRGNTLIEIQIKHFYKLKPKLSVLLCDHQIHIVHPIPIAKWVVRQDECGAVISRRKSPQKKNLYHVFDQLVYLTDYIPHPNLFLDILLVQQEDILKNDGKGSWRRKGWSTVDQRLIQITQQHCLHTLDDFADLIPADICSPFTTSSLAQAIGCPIRLAQKLTYTLSRIGILTMNGKIGKRNTYSLSTRNGR